MMRQTGGTAVGEISTRSSPFCLAMATACGGGMMPSCWPVSSITRISRTRIRSLTRTRSSRRGLLSKAITASSCCSAISGLWAFGSGLEAAPGDFAIGAGHEIAYRLSALVAAGARPDRHGPFSALAVADYEHVGDLLQLRLSDLISNLFLAGVQVGPEAGGLQPIPDRPGVVQMTV